MGRAARTALGGLVHHVLNRANARQTIFERDRDFAAFDKILEETKERVGTRILGYCLMPNHWHLVLWPSQDGELSTFMRILTLTHTQRWHAHRRSAGTGHLYQGRFKSFVVQTDAYYLTVCRYVERNALRANLVERAEDWHWGSLWRRQYGTEVQRSLLSEGPVSRPREWVRRVNEPEIPGELEAIRNCVVRGAPYGSASWIEKTAKRFGLQSTLRPRGRPPGSTKKAIIGS
jgi:putative transposase